MSRIKIQLLYVTSLLFMSFSGQAVLAGELRCRGIADIRGIFLNTGVHVLGENRIEIIHNKSGYLVFSDQSYKTNKYTQFKGFIFDIDGKQTKYYISLALLHSGRNEGKLMIEDSFARTKTFACLVNNKNIDPGFYGK